MGEKVLWKYFTAENIFNKDIEKLKIKEENEIITEEFSQLRNMRKELNELLLKGEIILRQKSRITWIKEGNQNTAYFH